MLKGWNSHAHREFPGNLESTNLSRDNLSTDIGRTQVRMNAKWQAGAVEDFVYYL